MRFKVILVISLIFTITACTYYEHGPVLSFKSVKTRLSGEWELTDVIINDKTDDVILENENDITYQFVEDGSLIIKSNSNTRSIPDVINGTWELNNDKTCIILDIDNINSEISIPKDEMTILRLTDDELWISDECSALRESDYITERRYRKISKL